MPVTQTYPGVYIEEIYRGEKTVLSVAIFILALIGRAKYGPTNAPTQMANFGDVDRKCGSLVVECSMSYVVRHFVLNGGVHTAVVRFASEWKCLGLSGFTLFPNASAITMTATSL